ncbi:hypothetical protein ACFX15_045279 [Malus domestica]
MANVYKPRNILITGAAGFIGSHVVNRLMRNYPEYKILVLDKLDYCSNLKNLHPSHSSPNLKFIKGDICSADFVNSILLNESIDTIMHFAAQTHVDNSFGNSFEFTKNNVYGTQVLLEACKVTGQIKRFIHVSTDEVYGETDENAVVGNHEASQLLPTKPYSATKAGSKMLVMAYGRSYGLPVITTRGNNVYGPNQFPEKMIPKFILLAMQGKRLPIYGNGSNFRSYLYCEDVAEAFEVILHRGEVGCVYNIGTKKERRLIDVAREICQHFSLNADAHIKFVQDRPFHDKRYFIDYKKLKALGWSQQTSWEDGLKKTLDWYVKNPDWWGDVSGTLLARPRNCKVYIKENKMIVTWKARQESVLYEFEGVLDFGKDADTNKLVVEVEDYVCPRELITELNKLKRVTAELRGAQQGSQNNQAQFHNKFGSMVIGESSKGTAKPEKLSHMTCRQKKTMGSGEVRNF